MNNQDYFAPARAVFELISSTLGDQNSSVPISTLLSTEHRLPRAELRDGLRMLVERGVVELRSGQRGSELTLGRALL